MSSSAVVLLGPQRFAPSLGDAVARAGVRGRLASVTAGWQERESEDRELHEHLGERTVNLRLYARLADAFDQDPQLAAAHREKQERLAALQALYRLRLGRGLQALRELHARGEAPELLEPEKEDALAAIRELDRRHTERLAAEHAAFERAWRPAERPALARQIASVERQLASCEAVAVAGGHVAVLLNRLRLFGFARLVGERALFAWSAGAMAATPRVVVFHHSPPQGFGNSELLDVGLGLVDGIVAFPHAERRLWLDDERRVGLLARRFAPDACLVLDDGGWLIERRGAWEPGPGVRRLAADGSLVALAA